MLASGDAGWKEWLGRIAVGAFGAGFLLIVALGLWAAFAQPHWLLDTTGLRGADLAKARNDFRGTMLTGVAGLAVILGALVGALTLRETGRQNRAVLELQWRGQVTDRFTKAVEHLGSEKLGIRVGAAYALEQVARDSVALHWPVIEILCDYLREQARYGPEVAPAPAAPAPGPQAPGAQAPGSLQDAVLVPDQASRVPLFGIGQIPADLQAIAIVIGRRRRSRDPGSVHLDLHHLNLQHVRWRGAQLQDAHLGQTLLNGAFLENTVLSGAFLGGVQMHNAYLRGAQLNRSYLVAGHLEDADLRNAQLRGANLGNALLQRADLSGAQLKDAYLGGANLDGANLAGVDLRKVKGLTMPQLHSGAAPLE
jgi:hypothetical protein